MHETTQTFSIPSTTGDGDSDRTVAALERIEERLARLEAAALRVEALEQHVPAAIATAADTFDDAMGRLYDSGVDVDERIRGLLAVLERLTSPEGLKALATMLDGARAEPPRKLGLWGVVHAMSDDDVQRAVGFLVRVAKLFGRSLEGKVSRRPVQPTGEPR